MNSDKQSSYHITVESTRDIAASSIDRKHLIHIFLKSRFLCIHNNDDADYDELDDEDNLGTSPTAMAQVDAPVFDVTFCLLGKSHHLE